VMKGAGYLVVGIWKGWGDKVYIFGFCTKLCG
jgi:hypothetical protein